MSTTQADDCTLDSTAMLSMFGLQLVLAILNVFMSSLLSCVGRKTLFISIQIAASIVAMLMNFSTIWYVTALFLVVYMLGLLNFGLLATFSVDMYPTYVKAMGVCLTLMIGRGSAVLGINLLKILLTYHCEYTFYVFGSISIRYGKFNLLTMAISSNVIIAMCTETSSVAYLVPASACELHTTPEQQGLMAGTPLIGILAASNIWGYLADTRGRRKMIIVAMVLGFITGCSATFAPNWIVFCICKFLSACAMAGTNGLGYTLLSESTPAMHRSKLILLLVSIFAITGGGMAAITIPILQLKFSYYIPYLDIHFNAWRLLNIIYSLPCAVGIITTYFAFESPKYLMSAGRSEEALDTLKKIYEMNTGEDESKFKVSALILDEHSGSSVKAGFFRSVINQTVPLFKPGLLRHTLLLATLFISVYFCSSTFMVWLPFIFDAIMKSVGKGETGLTFCQMLQSTAANVTIIEEKTADDCTLDSTAMLSMLGLQLVLAVLNVFMSSLLSCVGRKTLFISIQISASIVAMLINFSTIWYVTALLLVIFMIVLLNYGLLSTFSVDMFPTYVKAMGVCLTLMIGRGSAVLGINLLKNLLTYHCEYTFYVFGSISILGGIFGFFLPSEKKMQEKYSDEQNPSPKKLNS